MVTYTRPPKSIRPVTLSDLLPLSDPVLLLFYFVTNRPPNRKKQNKISVKIETDRIKKPVKDVQNKYKTVGERHVLSFNTSWMA